MKAKLATTMLVILLAASGCGDGGDAPASESEGTPKPAASNTQQADQDGYENPDEPYGDVLEKWTAADGENAWVCVTDLNGSLARIPLPFLQSGGLIDEMEAYRKKVGVEGKPTYMLVEIDSTQASEAATGPGEITWATADQETQTAKEVDELVMEWQDKAGDDTDLYNEGVALYNKLIEWPNAGAKGEKVYVVDGPVESTTALQGKLWEACSLEKSLQ